MRRGDVARALAFVRGEMALVAGRRPEGQAWLAGQVTSVLLRGRDDGGDMGNASNEHASDGDATGRGRASGESRPGDASPDTSALARSLLLDQVLSTLPPSFRPPPRRLASLLEQALEAQVARAPLHNSARPALSLLRDYRPATPAQLPQSVAQVLFDHEDEVWHVAFSHSGALLASASRDGTAVVWEVHAAKPACPLRRRHTLADGAGPIAFLAWSADDALLACCSQDGCVRVWDTASGRRVRALRHHAEPVTSAAWLPGRRGLVTAGFDERVCLVDPVTGAVRRHWHVPRVQEIVVAKRGAYVLATTSEKRIAVLDLAREGALRRGGAAEQATWADQDWAEPRAGVGSAARPVLAPWMAIGPGHSLAYIQETDPVLTMSLSGDERYLLVRVVGVVIKRREKACNDYSGGALKVERKACMTSRMCYGTLYNLPKTLPNHQVNLFNSTMRLYDLGPDPDALRVPVAPCAQFEPAAARQRRFVVRSCLGGVGDRFAVSGSETGKVRVGVWK